MARGLSRKKRRKLIRIKPDEISLVDKPANKREFFFIKGEEDMDKLSEVLATLSIDPDAIDEESLADEPLRMALFEISKAVSVFPQALETAIKHVISKALSAKTQKEDKDEKDEKDEGSKGDGDKDGDEGEFTIEDIQGAVKEGISVAMAGMQEKVDALASEVKTISERDEPDKDKKEDKVYSEDEVAEMVELAVEQAIDQYAGGSNADK